MKPDTHIAVVGLGYVGLPLAIGFAKHFPVTGFDVDAARIRELEADQDRTGEVGPSELNAYGGSFTVDTGQLDAANVYVVTVPTPVDRDNQPDLGAIRQACVTIGKSLRSGDIVVFECTVYPGVTEDVCGPALEEASGLVCGRDFFLGYSPERINPGDREHTVEKITKIIAGQTPEVTRQLENIYGRLTNGNLFVARDIKTAEAAKVIENAQRDINIAFINEVSMIFEKLGVSVSDVLAAAGTKWNFLDFRPGLVGGHCIGVDPFYLAHCAQAMGHEPEVILAGRRINDRMGQFIAERIHEVLSDVPALAEPKRILVMGLTFKENVPDLRNTKVVDVVNGLRSHGYEVDVHDPLADPASARGLYGIELLSCLDDANGYDCVVGAVAHAPYEELTSADLEALLAPGGLVADIKNIWNGIELPDSLRRWRL